MATLYALFTEKIPFEVAVHTMELERGARTKGIPKITLASCGRKLFLTTLDFQVPTSLSIRDETLFSPTTCFLRLITLKVIRVGIHLSS